jgi:tRNA A-37 threonylcarbamoyl transferase component Bud32/tetratricopeptide (TPR) repeat protein
LPEGDFPGGEQEQAEVEATLQGSPEAPSTAPPVRRPTYPGVDRPNGPAPTAVVNGPPTTPRHDGPDTAAGPGPDHTLVRPSASAVPPSGASGGTTPASTPSGLSGPSGSVSGYEILSVLGRGGMGVVYKARQVGLNRVVALKMILAGSHASDEERLRFKIEAEAIAELVHPNIVQVFDSGVRDGRPYFSLEYLEGGSLQQKLEGGVAAPVRPAAESARLVEVLARALDFAHRRGIIHRDIKPANILLTRDGVPKITDFGLAKRLQQDEGHTATDAILGTPAYMAPEQAQGKVREVGPAADIYSLGAVLYDLLTGRPPFRGNSALDTLALVQNAEPVPPSRLQKKLPRDLETICLKCLQKDAKKRYASAGDLADDLLAFLERRPIRARPVGRAERVGKWARRNPAAALAAALLVAVPFLVTGGSVAFSVRLAQVNRDLDATNEELTNKKNLLEGTTTSLRKANARLARETADKEKARELEERQRKRAEAQERDAQESFLLAQDAADRLLKTAQKLLRNQPGTEEMRQEILGEALKMSVRFTARPGNNPAARLRAARAHRMVGEIEQTLGLGSAKGHYEESLKHYRGLIDQEPAAGQKAGYEGEALQVAMKRWEVLEADDPAQAEAFLDEVVGQFYRPGGPAPGRVVSRRNLAVLLANRALSRQRRGKAHEADEDYQAAVALLGPLKDTPEGKLELARVNSNRAALWVACDPDHPSRRGGLPGKALEACEKAVADLRELRQKDPGRVEYANALGQAYFNQALALLALRKYAQAEAVHDRAVELFAKLTQDAPRVVDYRYQHALALGNRGQFLLVTRAPRAAEKSLQLARAALEPLVRDFPDTAEYQEALARVCATQGQAYLEAAQPRAAREPLEKAVALWSGVRRKPREAATVGSAVWAWSSPRSTVVDASLALWVARSAAAGPRDAAGQGELSAARLALIYCLDQMVRAAVLGRRTPAGRGPDDQAAALPLVGRLAELRRERLDDLPALPADRPLSARLWRAGERIGRRAQLAGTLLYLTRLQVGQGDHRGAARSVADLAALVSPQWPDYPDSAAVLARCVSLARNDVRLSPAARARAAEGYARAALALLRRLAPYHPALGERIRKADFDGLRSFGPLQEEVRRLQGELFEKDEGGRRKDQ